MDESAQDAEQDASLAALSAIAALYAAMLGATVAGQLGGIGINALLGTHRLWIPVACSVVAEALAGARAGAARQGRSLTQAEAARISATYSLGLLALSVPLAVWVMASRPAGSAPLGISFAGVLLAVAVFLVATGARWALMVGFAPRRR